MMMIFLTLWVSLSSRFRVRQGGETRRFNLPFFSSSPLFVRSFDSSVSPQGPSFFISLLLPISTHARSAFTVADRRFGMFARRV